MPLSPQESGQAPFPRCEGCSGPPHPVPAVCNWLWPWLFLSSTPGCRVPFCASLFFLRSHSLGPHHAQGLSGEEVPLLECVAGGELQARVTDAKTPSFQALVSHPLPSVSQMASERSMSGVALRALIILGLCSRRAAPLPEAQEGHSLPEREGEGRGPVCCSLAGRWSPSKMPSGGLQCQGQPERDSFTL